jgi:hypothetical protein
VYCVVVPKMFRVFSYRMSSCFMNPNVNTGVALMSTWLMLNIAYRGTIGSVEIILRRIQDMLTNLLCIAKLTPKDAHVNAKDMNCPHPDCSLKNAHCSLILLKQSCIGVFVLKYEKRKAETADLLWSK